MNFSPFSLICDPQLKASVWKLSHKLSITAAKVQSSILLYSDRALFYSVSYNNLNFEALGTKLLFHFGISSNLLVIKAKS